MNKFSQLKKKKEKRIEHSTRRYSFPFFEQIEIVEKNKNTRAKSSSFW